MYMVSLFEEEDVEDFMGHLPLDLMHMVCVTDL
jgi:hypothetical protein